MANEQLKPFTADDPRINRNGRPRDYEELRKLVRKVGYEEVVVNEDGSTMTMIESIVRDWMTSKSFRKQLAAIQYGFGKVPEKLEVERNASKIVIRSTEVDEDPEYIEDDSEAEFTLNSALPGGFETPHRSASLGEGSPPLLESSDIDPED